MNDNNRQEAILKYRTKMLPIQLDRARRKYVALVREAKRLKMYNLLSNKEMYEVGEDHGKASMVWGQQNTG